MDRAEMTSFFINSLGFVIDLRSHCLLSYLVKYPDPRNQSVDLVLGSQKG